MAIKDEISKYAYDASYQFLQHQKPLSKTIIVIGAKNNLNSEVLKRICEKANQNVYLTLFNSKGVDRSNIKFPRADAEEVMGGVQQQGATNDYQITPAEHEIVVGKPDIPAKNTGIMDERDEMQLTLEKIRNLLASVKNMLSEEKTAASKSLDEFYGNVKNMVGNGESFGDIAKMAMRFASTKDVNVEKTADILKYAKDHLTKEGHRISTEITKISSEGINPNFELFQNVQNCVESIEKVAGLTEMFNNISKRFKVAESAFLGKGLEKNAEVKNLYRLLKGLSEVRYK